MNNDQIKERLKEIKKNSSTTTQKALYYQGSSKVFNVYEVDLSLLSFNPRNGRIGSIVEEYRQEHGTDILDMQIDDRNELIHNWILKKNKSKNQNTYDDIKVKTQLEAAVITSDGLVVDGNRRFMTLRRLKEEGDTRKIKTIILNETYTDSPDEGLDIEKLETTIQLGKDPTLGYDPMEKYIKARKLVTQYSREQLPKAEIVEMMGLKNKGGEKELNKLVGICKMMDQYLSFVGMPKMYSTIAEQEDLFIFLTATHALYGKGGGAIQWNVAINDIDDHKEAAFNSLRYIYNVSPKKRPVETKKLREILFMNSKKGLFANKSTWQEYKKDINLDNLHELISPNDQKKEIQNMIQNNGLSYGEAGRKMNEKWAEKAHPGFAKGINRGIDSLDTLHKENTPITLLEAALSKLSQFVDKDDLKKGLYNLNDEVFDKINKNKHTPDAKSISQHIRKISELIQKNLKT